MTTKTHARRASSGNRHRRLQPSSFIALVVTSVGIAVSGTARASDLYARLLAGPASLYTGDFSSAAGDDAARGPGLVSQVDLGVRLGRSLALHASLVYDTSHWMSFDTFARGNGSYETTVLGLGIGAARTWGHFSLGAVLGGQLTTFPPEDDGAPFVPEAARFGPLFSVSAGYVVPEASENIELGAHVLGRYRFAEDSYEPPGYQLGLGLSIAFTDTGSKVNVLDERELQERELQELGLMQREPHAEPSFGYASAQMGWWNAEIEFLSRVGIYVAVGAPWVKALDGVTDDGRTYIPFGGRLGYQLDVSNEWGVRASAHLVGWRDLDQDCGYCADYTDTWQLFELGARHRSASGFLYGVDVPLIAIENILGLDDGDPRNEEVWFPPHSFGLTQVYVGYSWAM